MRLSTILFLIVLVINILCAYILHNSKWKPDGYRIVPFKLPIALWLIIFIVMFIPALNVIAAFVHIILLAIGYGDNTLKLNENFWLSKEI